VAIYGGYATGRRGRIRQRHSSGERPQNTGNDHKISTKSQSEKSIKTGANSPVIESKNRKIRNKKVGKIEEESGKLFKARKRKKKLG